MYAESHFLFYFNGKQKWGETEMSFRVCAFGAPRNDNAFVMTQNSSRSSQKLVTTDESLSYAG